MDPIEMEVIVGDNYYLKRNPSYLDKIVGLLGRIKDSARGYIVSLEREITGNRIKYSLEK